MKRANLFPSKYLRASDLNGKEVGVQISAVALEPVGQDKSMKAVVYFANKQKGMVLNATNYDRLAEKFGDETDDWGGKDLVLFTELTRNPQGATVPGLRLRPVTDLKKEFDDEIPF
jgi:hypothetical protein